MAAPPGSIGPYRIVGTLGRGGMSVVYEGRHAESGLAAAVKTVDIPDGGTLSALRREIRMLAKVRHPGVVRILEEGLAAGRPWYAMELLEGETLRSLCSARPTGEATGSVTVMEPTLPLDEAARGGAGAADDVEPGERRAGMPVEDLPPAAGGNLAEVLTLVRRLCAPLAFLHGEGFVHRDLKPENVMLLPGGRPVLMDFGIVSELGGARTRDSLAISAELAGTVAYMAPEQSRGALVDARADLYALGCILHELLTGQPPFVGRTATDVLRQHWSATPLPPSTFRSGVPPALDALVLALLAKEPADRPGHAGLVVDVLARLGAEGDPESEGIRPRSYLYRARLAGRSAAVQMLATRLAALRTGQGMGGGIILLSGQSGSGKTRLLVETLVLASQAAIATVSGSSALPESGPVKPLGALQSLLQAAADVCLHDRGARARMTGRPAAALAPFEPAFGELTGSDPAAPVVAGDRSELLRAVLEAAACVGRRGPLLLALDDLQWADDLTTSALARLLRDGREELQALLVVAAHRSEDPSPAVEALREIPGAATVRIGGLDGADVGAVVADMMAAPSPPAALVADLTQRSEGNPFFIAEYLRTAVAEGLLVRRTTDGRWELAADAARGRSLSALPLPDGIEELLERRLSVLSPQARETLEMASVLGREFDDGLLTSLSEREDDRWESLRELRIRELVEERPGGHRIGHERIREAAYRGIAPARRVTLHRRAAEALERRPACATDPGLAADLARHWHVAGEIEKAKTHYYAASSLSGARYAHDLTESLLRTYLSLVDRHDATSLQAWCDLIQGVLLVRGRYQEAADEGQRALAAAMQAGVRSKEALARRGLADSYRFLGRRAEAETLAREALAIASEIGDGLTEVRCLQSLTVLDYEAGRLAETAPMQQRCYELAMEHGDAAAQIVALSNLGIVHKDLGDFEKGRDFLARALALAQSVGSRRFEGLARAGLSVIAAIEGRLDDAELLLREGIVTGREVGDTYMEAIAENNLGLLLAARGEHVEAAEQLRAALVHQGSRGDRSAELFVRTRLGGCLLTLRRLDEARRELERALREARELGIPRGEVASLASLAELAVVEGDLVQARALAEEARTLLETDDGPVERWEVGMDLCTLGHVALALGEDGAPFLERADALTAGRPSFRYPMLVRARQQLADAVAAHRAGTPLSCGRVPEAE